MYLTPDLIEMKIMNDTFKSLFILHHRYVVLNTQLNTSHLKRSFTGTVTGYIDDFDPLNIREDRNGSVYHSAMEFLLSVWCFVS